MTARVFKVRDRALNWGQEVGKGAIAGIAGGIVFAMPMAMMGVLPMIASMVDSNSSFVGLGLHLVISAVIGGIYGGAFGNRCSLQQYKTGWLTGLGYGMLWWILGPLLIMPTMLGMGPQFGAAFSQTNILSLMGHAMYGMVTGLTFVYLIRR